MGVTKIEDEILDRVNEVIKYLKIDCPDCESMYSDNQYTCTTCWCEGGQGKLNLLDYVKINKK